MTDKPAWDIGKIDPGLLAEAAREAREMEGETEAAMQNHGSKCEEGRCRLRGTPVSEAFGAIMQTMEDLVERYGHRGRDAEKVAHAALISVVFSATAGGSKAVRRATARNIAGLIRAMDNCESEDDLKALVHDVLEQIQFGDD